MKTSVSMVMRWGIRWLKTHKKRVLLGVLLGVGFLASLSLVKLGWYELNPKLDVIRSSVGKEVVLTTDDLLNPIWQGTLTEAHYERDDEWGFFFLRISVAGDRGGISTYLGPSELWRIKPINE